MKLSDFKTPVAILAAITLNGCGQDRQDVNASSASPNGSNAPQKAPHQIDCYSGGQEVYNGTSVGEVNSADGSYQFTESGTNNAKNVPVNLCFLTVPASPSTAPSPSN